MQATSTTHAWTSAILDDCHRLVLNHIHTLMTKMFDRSDVAFQEFIDKAQSNTSQIRFMEAMGIIKRNHAHVAEIFYRQVGNSFKEFGALKFAEQPASEQTGKPLGLVSLEDSDIQVALQSMIASASLGSTHVLYAIRQRLAVLNNGRKLKEEQVPAGPHCLANAFHQAARELVLDHETRLIVYMLFDKFVLSRSARMYEEYNQRLLKAGLLPNLKYEVHKYPAAVQRPAGDGVSTGNRTPDRNRDEHPNGVSLGDELFTSILQLLSRRDRHQISDSDAAAPLDPLPRAEVVSVIHQLQLRRHSDLPGGTGNMAAHGAKADAHAVRTMREQLSEERERLFTGIDRRRLPTADTQVIDLVGMMFEYLLNDPGLPSVAKAELCRLHTPYLKIAIIDKTLFTNASHPAHELLNLLASAGTKWIFEQDLTRGIFPTMRMVIQRIIEEFENNFDLFDELLVLCRNSIQELEQKAAAIEQRTRQAAAGREKLELARTRAAEAIEARLAGHNTPAELRKIFVDAWIDKLMFIYLREPESEYSTIWSLAIQTIDNIIWSVEPRVTGESLAELREKLPSLRRKIERAFERLDAYGASDNKSQLELINRLQDLAAADPSQETAGHTQLPEQDTPLPAPASEPVESSATPIATEADDTDLRPAETEATPRLAGKTDVAEHTPAREAETHHGNSSHLSHAVKAALARVDELSFGTWFTFREDEDEPPLRLKLSWFSQLSGNYMFVDSMGIRAAVINRFELASRIASGKVKIMSRDKQSFITRAMEAVRRMLNSSQPVLPDTAAGRMPG